MGGTAAGVRRALALAMLCGAATAAPAAAQDDPAYQAATCAALWTAHARSSLGPGEDPLGFRDEAVRLSGDPEAIDAFIATQTMRLTDLIDAYVELADPQSREFVEGLVRTCEHFAARNPQISGPEGSTDPDAAPRAGVLEPSG